MRCPFCGTEDDRVIDSRGMQNGESIRRRRECKNCLRRFTTYERVEEIRLMIIKRDRRREPFNRQKISGGIRIACQKRPISEQQIEDLTALIERDLHQHYEKEVDHTVVSEVVMAKLRDLDPVAYVRFASVNRVFNDVRQFVEEIKQLTGTDAASSPDDDGDART